MLCSARTNSRNRRWSPAGLCLGISAAVFLSSCSAGPQQRPVQAPVPVIVAAVVSKDVPVQVTAIGNVEAYSTVSVKTQVSGELTAVHFTEGQDVKEGALLFEIDSRPFASDLERAQANLARDSAQLRQAEANLARDIA